MFQKFQIYPFRTISNFELRALRFVNIGILTFASNLDKGILYKELSLPAALTALGTPLAGLELSVYNENTGDRIQKEMPRLQKMV